VTNADYDHFLVRDFIEKQIGIRRRRYTSQMSIACAPPAVGLLLQQFGDHLNAALYASRALR
jgi:hypothetical protein